MILDNFKVLNACLLSPLSYLNRFKSKQVIDNHAIFLKILNDGLYHISSEENIDNILKSQEILASKKNDIYLYARDKVHFFAGIPDFDLLSLHCPVQENIVALKIKPTYEQLVNFKVRTNDDVIVYEGNCALNDYQATKVYLKLKCRDSEFYYEESTSKSFVSKEEFDNWRKKSILKLKGFQKAMLLEYRNLLEKQNLFHLNQESKEDLKSYK